MQLCLVPQHFAKQSSPVVWAVQHHKFVGQNTHAWCAGQRSARPHNVVAGITPKRVNNTWATSANRALSAGHLVSGHICEHGAAVLRDQLPDASLVVGAASNASEQEGHAAEDAAAAPQATAPAGPAAGPAAAAAAASLAASPATAAGSAADAAEAATRAPPQPLRKFGRRRLRRRRCATVGRLLLLLLGVVPGRG